MKTTSKRSFLRSVLCCLMTMALIVTLIGRSPSAAQTRSTNWATSQSKTRLPNIVFILADDLGWTDLSGYGSKYYETPNIDRLAAQGLKFTSAYTAAPNCSPTRASLMTGVYTPRHGIWTAIGGAGDQAPPASAKLISAPNGNRLPLEFVTIAQSLKASGYATGMFGKWHLGQQGEYHPARRGFDEAIESMGRHFNFRTNPPVKDLPPETYLADFLAQQAEGFLERHKDQPFFLYLPHFAVHVPHEAKKELIAKYEKKPTAGGHRNPTYAAMIDSLDQAVGRVMAKLDALGLSENTVLIFSSDNGGVGGYTTSDGRPENRNVTSNAPLRGGKGQLYEGGVRVPLIVRWPGVVKAGSVTPQPVISMDFFPTFLQLAESKQNPAQPRDGVSLVPLLKSSGKTKFDRDLYWHFPGYLPGRTTPVGSIRSGDWKLIEFFEDGKVELYNLAQDLGERNDLAAKMPDKARELQRKLSEWRRAVKAPMPTMKPPQQ